MLQKAATIKIRHLSLGSELKKQTNAVEKQYQKLDKVFESNEKEEEKIKKVVPSQILSTVKKKHFINTTTLKKLLNVLFVENKMI